MWMFNLLYSSLSSTLICRGTDISKCFSEYLGIRDNGSRLYVPSLAFRMSKLHSFSFFGHTPKLPFYPVLLWFSTKILFEHVYIVYFHSIRLNYQIKNLMMLEKCRTRSCVGVFAEHTWDRVYWPNIFLNFFLNVWETLNKLWQHSYIFRNRGLFSTNCAMFFVARRRQTSKWRYEFSYLSWCKSFEIYRLWCVTTVRPAYTFNRVQWRS